LAEQADNTLGIRQRMVVAPVARSSLITGRAVAAGLRAVAQVAIVLAVIAIARIPLRWSVLGIVGALVVSLIGAMLFSSISMVIASAMRSREQFMGLGQLITLPLFFASNALYPIALMPQWLRDVARLNPLTYLVELLRWLLLDIGPQTVPRAVAIVVVGTIIAITAASRLYPRRVM